MAEADDSIQPVDWSRASAEPEVAGGQDDPLAEAERAYLEMTPTARGNYDHIKLVERLDAHIERVRIERDNHCNEADRLKMIETDHEVLKNFISNWRAPIALSAVAMAIGGAVISSHAGDAGSKFWLGFGWCLLLLPGILTLYLSVFGKQKNK